MDIQFVWGCLKRYLFLIFTITFFQEMITNINTLDWIWKCLLYHLINLSCYLDIARGQENVLIHNHLIAAYQHYLPYLVEILFSMFCFVNTFVCPTPSYVSVQCLTFLTVYCNRVQFNIVMKLIQTFTKKVFDQIKFNTHLHNHHNLFSAILVSKRLGIWLKCFTLFS